MTRPKAVKWDGPPDVVSISGVAEVAGKGMTPQRASQIMTEEGAPPATTTSAGQVWYRSDVELFFAMRKEAPRKLTAGQRAEIRARRGSESQSKTAAEFGVTQAYVSRLQAGQGLESSAAT